MTYSARLLTFKLLLVVSFLPEKECAAQYPTIDYMLVRRKLDTLNTDWITHGYQPTVTSLTNGEKSLTFFGTSHVRNVDHPQFSALVAAFRAQKPQLAFNEGGVIPKTTRYTSVEEAIRIRGEKGVLKYLCDQANIDLLNGDMDTRAEFTELLRRFPRESVYLYMAVERFLNPFRQGYYKGTYEVAFQREHVAYLEQNGFKLSSPEKTTAYLRRLYRRYLHKPLNLNYLIPVQDYYLTNTGILGQLGRASKDIRDQALLTKIDQALNQYDRVFVVFGGSHWVAVQPALPYLINKSRP